MPGWAPIVIGAVVVLVLVIVLFKAMWKVPRANEALIVTGAGIGKNQDDAARSYKVVTGSGAFVIPLLQRAQYLGLSPTQVLLHVGGFDKQKIPIGIRGSVVFKVGNSQQEITNAAIRFLDEQDTPRGSDQSQMAALVQEVVHGHLRSMIGGLSVEEIIGDRNALAQEARAASVTEIEAMGLVIDSLQVQEIDDPSGYIAALGEPKTAEVKMNARIAQAARDREASEREAEARALTAEANAAAAQREATAQAEIERVQARTEQAGPLAEAEARKAVVQQETQVAQLEAEREQRRLEATIHKQADAEAYAQRVRAQAERDARVAAAEAEAQEKALTGEAEAKITTLAGAAEADAIRAKGLAEAEAIAKRAEALEKHADAVIGQTVAEQLPEIVKQAASAFANVDNMVVMNGAKGVGEMLTQVVTQVGPLLGAAREALDSSNVAKSNGHEPKVGERVVERRAERNP